MATKRKQGFLVLDRKGEYIKDTIDQRGNTVYGLHHHPKASGMMVVVSMRDDLSRLKGREILDFLEPHFNIADINPLDLADFLPGLTKQQKDLVRDYAYVDGFYEKLLAENQFGMIDKTHWYRDFPGLFELKDKGKKLFKQFEERAKEEERTELSDEECDVLEAESTGPKPGVLERAASAVKRFCLNPFFGRSARGRAIVMSPTCVPQILKYLEQGKFVFIDMRGQSDESYTMVAALFARRLLAENKCREDADQIRACLVMEEAHNILSEEELSKGSGTGSVFVELAREGRSFKLGFILVTQQPDARSIAPEVVKTIDTVVAFNMPPDDARHLQRLKSAFNGLEFEICNAPEFRGVAISGGGPIFFQSAAIDADFMRASVDAALLEGFFLSRASAEATRPVSTEPQLPVPSIEDRLQMLMRERQTNIGPIALDTMRIWREDEGTTNADEVSY